MADPVVPAPELPLTGGAPAPVVAAAVTEPVVPAAPEPAAAPVTEPVVPEPVKTVAETPTLLEEIADADKPKEAAKVEAKPEDAKPGEVKPAEVKPVEVKPEEKPAEKPVEVKPAEPVKPEPIAYEYALPETIKMDDTLKGEFHSALDAFRADPLKGAQPLVELHNKAMTDYANHLAQEQQKAFADTRKGWRTDVMADEQLGGSGYQTTMKAIARMRDLAVPEKDRASFNEFLRITGAGDHPAFLRMVHNFARHFDEPSSDVATGKPSPENGRQRRGGRILYDNPRSPGPRQ